MSGSSPKATCPCCGAALSVRMALIPSLPWEGVDWRRKDRDIARSMEVSVNTVRQARYKYSPETIRKRRNHNWEEVDWNQRNVDIADQLGCSQSYVAQVRRQRAKRSDDPRAKAPRRQTTRSRTGH